MMGGRENPVTRPSVFRTQDALNGAFGNDHANSAFFTSPYTQHFTLESFATGTAVGAAGFVSAPPTRFSPTSANGAGSVLGQPSRVDTPASTEVLLHPLNSTNTTNPFNGLHHRFVDPNSTRLGGGEGLQRQPSVRTFSQLSAAATFPIASPTSALFSADGSLPRWAEHNLSAPMSSGESLANAAFGGEALLQRPLGPDTIREAVYAYLEATDKHDVVMAMLADERRHSKRSLEAGPSASFSHTADVFASNADVSGLRPADHRANRSGGAALGGTGAAATAGALSTPSSGLQVHSRVTSVSGISGAANHLFSFPARELGLQSLSSTGDGPVQPGGSEGCRGRQRRSHDLLRKGMLDRHATERHQSEGHANTAEVGKASPHSSSPRRGHAGGGINASAVADAASRPSSPSILDSANHGDKGGAGANQRLGKQVPSPIRRQHLPKVLPTLCGLEEAVRPDLILLYSDLEKKIAEQYRQLSIPPPSHEVLQYLLTQAYEPMWSVGEDANTFHLFEPANPVTGMVLYGTLNQMVEQLTQVHVMPFSTPSDVILKNGRSFCDAFLRRHRMLMPSHVLLAKLMERYLVPLSLHLGFERFKVHGITVHIPGMGTLLPARRSQSETVLHGRRHSGATSGTTVSASGASGGMLSAGECGVWGSGTTRLPAKLLSQQPQRQAPEAGNFGLGTSAAVEDYVRATAADTSPDAALIAVVRSGMVPAMTNDFTAAPTNAAIGTVSGSTLTSNPAFTTMPHREASGGFPSDAGVAKLSGLRLNGGGGAASRPAVELVTTYSPSATLWLTVCENVQLKVLSVLLYWLQHHPHHFDGEMLSSVLHFVESCCYGTCVWADCPSRQPQIAEFIRQACYAALPLATHRLGGLSVSGGALPFPANGSGSATVSAQFAVFPPISKEWRDGVLSGTWERRRYQMLIEAIPPSLRHSVKAEFLPWTWITPMGSLTPRQYLPCFAFRTLPSVDVLSYPGEERHLQCYYQRNQRHSPAIATQMPSDIKSGVPEVTKLHVVAHEALQLFASCTFETYVRGLTAAHYRMFIAFPSQDIFIAAQHSSLSYLTSPVFQSSFLGRFLNSSAFLTLWCVSLLLHAAYLDGERAAAVVAVTNLSILNSFVGDMQEYRVHVASEADGGCGNTGGANHSAGRSLSSSTSVSNSSLSTASAATASVAGVSQSVTGGGGGNNNNATKINHFIAPGDSDAAATARHNAFLHNPARQFLDVLDRLVDLVVGFLRVNNLHASYSIFRGFHHPFVLKLRQHRRISMHIHAQTAHRIRKLEGFFTSIPPAPATPRNTKSERAASTGDAIKQSATVASAAAAAGVGDPTVDDDLVAPGNDNNNTTEASSNSPVGGAAPHKNRKPHHSFFEYLNTVPDGVEYPTVPVVQYYLRELQMVFALEPTFFTVPSHQMQSRFLSEEVRLTDTFAMSNAGPEEGRTPTAAPPIAVVNWRKMHLIDDWIQRVGSNQMSCLHYISSRSTVVRNIVPDLEFEKAFDVQLSRVVVANTTLLQEMASKLFNAL